MSKRKCTCATTPVLTRTPEIRGYSHSSSFVKILETMISSSATIGISFIFICWMSSFWMTDLMTSQVNFQRGMGEDDCSRSEFSVLISSCDEVIENDSSLSFSVNEDHRSVAFGAVHMLNTSAGCVGSLVDLIKTEINCRQQKRSPVATRYLANNGDELQKIRLEVERFETYFPLIEDPIDQYKYLRHVAVSRLFRDELLSNPKK